MLAILEPHIKKTTTIYVNSVWKDLYTVLCAVRWSGWIWQSSFWILAFACTVALNCHTFVKTPLMCHACLPRMRKKLNKKSNPMNFFLWRTKISVAVCKSDWHNVRSYLFFNVWTFRKKLTLFCAMTLTQEYTFLVHILLWLAEHFYQYSLLISVCTVCVKPWLLWPCSKSDLRAWKERSTRSIHTLEWSERTVAFSFCFPKLSWRPPCPAPFVRLPYRTHLIPLISSLVETARTKLGVSD